MNYSKNRFVSLILAGYIVLLSYLLISGNISKYINPRLAFLSVMALLMLVGMLFFSLKWGHKTTGHAHQCNCSHHDMEKLKKSNFILLLPILLAFMAPPQIISYQPVNNSDIIPPSIKNQPSSAPESTKISSPQKGRLTTEYEECTQLEIVNIIFMNDEAAKQKLLNTKVMMQGMVLHWNQLKANEVIVYRMMIACCAADGLPLGILTKLPRDMNFNDGDWIRVEGTIQMLPFTDEIKNIEPVVVTVPVGNQYPYLTATNAYKINAPAEPYLFP